MWAHVSAARTSDPPRGALSSTDWPLGHRLAWTGHRGSSTCLGKPRYALQTATKAHALRDAVESIRALSAPLGFVLMPRLEMPAGRSGSRR